LPEEVLSLFGVYTYTHACTHNLLPCIYAREEKGSLVIDLHRHSVRMCVYGALPLVFLDIKKGKEMREPAAGTHVHTHTHTHTHTLQIVTGHGRGYKKKEKRLKQGLMNKETDAPDTDTDTDTQTPTKTYPPPVLFTSIKAWLEARLPPGTVQTHTQGCLSIEGKTIRENLQKLLH
jgi:hypothetical protein